MRTHVISISLFLSFLLPYSIYGQKVQKLIKNGEIDKAISYCENKNGKLNCFEVIGDYYFKNQEIANAEKYYLKSTRPDKGLLKIANYYLKNNDFLNAEKYFNLTEAPNKGMLLLADGYLKKGNYKDAERCYENAGFLEEGANRIADALFVERDYAKALAYYKKAGKDFSIEELEKNHKEIIEKKEVFGLMGLKPYTEEKKISIFNPRVMDKKILYITYVLENAKENAFVVVIRYSDKNGNIAFEPHVPKNMKGYFHTYSLSLNTIETKLSESSTQAKEIRVYLVDADLISSKPISNTVTFYMK